MKNVPPRSVCFARDKYHLHQDIRNDLGNGKGGGAEGKFKKGLDELIRNHKGAIHDTRITAFMSNGDKRTVRSVVIRFTDGSTARMPNTKDVFSEPDPFKYYAKEQEKIPANWSQDDFIVGEKPEDGAEDVPASPEVPQTAMALAFEAANLEQTGQP